MAYFRIFTAVKVEQRQGFKDKVVPQVKFYGDFQAFDIEEARLKARRNLQRHDFELTEIRYEEMVQNKRLEW